MKHTSNKSVKIGEMDFQPVHGSISNNSCVFFIHSVHTIH